jgi:DNA-binding NarL/FixJ family response regulator
MRGRRGFVLKDAVSADLVRIIKEVHGRNMCCSTISATSSGSGGLTTLTTREIELLELLTQGSAPGITAALGSATTVRFIRSV